MEVTLYSRSTENVKQAVALESRRNHSSAVHRTLSPKARLLRTACDGFVVLFLGLCVAQKGPSFLDLQLISGTDVEGVSSYFTASNFGYMVGALTSGFLYDRLSNKLLLICFPLTLASIAVAVIPKCTSYVSMLILHLVSISLHAVPETTITADQLWIWEGKSDPAIQFMSFMYSAGGVLSPLYTEPFLAPIRNDSATRTVPAQQSEDTSNNSLYSNNSSALDHAMLQSHYLSNFSIPNNNVTLVVSEPEESQIFYAYLISGIFGILSAIPFYVLFVRSICHKKTKHSLKDKNSQSQKESYLAKKPYVLLTFAVCVFFFFYTMTEDSFNLFLSMFVVSHLSWTKASAALLSSLYWAIGTVSKLIVVFLSSKVSSSIIILVSCVGMVVSLTLFLSASHFQVHNLVWLSCSCFALSQASVFGGGLAWADANLLKLDGKATSATMVFASLGAMAGPLILGITMEKLSVMVFPYLELLFSMICLVQFLIMLLILKPFVFLKYGPPRSETINVSGTGDEEEKQKMFTSIKDSRENIQENGSEREVSKLSIQDVKI